MTVRQPKGTRVGGQFAADVRSDDIDDLDVQEPLTGAERNSLHHEQRLIADMAAVDLPPGEMVTFIRPDADQPGDPHLVTGVSADDDDAVASVRARRWMGDHWDDNETEFSAVDGVRAARMTDTQKEHYPADHVRVHDVDMAHRFTEGVVHQGVRSGVLHPSQRTENRWSTGYVEVGKLRDRRGKSQGRLFAEITVDHHLGRQTTVDGEDTDEQYSAQISYGLKGPGQSKIKSIGSQQGVPEAVRELPEPLARIARVGRNTMAQGTRTQAAAIRNGQVGAGDIPADDHGRRFGEEILYEPLPHQVYGDALRTMEQLKKKA